MLTLWPLLMLCIYNISEVKSNQNKVIIELLPGASLLTNSAVDDQPHLIVIAADTCENLEALMRELTSSRLEVIHLYPYPYPYTYPYTYSMIFILIYTVPKEYVRMYFFVSLNLFEI